MHVSLCFLRQILSKILDDSSTLCINLQIEEFTDFIEIWIFRINIQIYYIECNLIIERMNELLNRIQTAQTL